MNFEVVKTETGWLIRNKGTSDIVLMQGLGEVIEARDILNGIISGIAAKAVAPPPDESAVITSGEAMKLASDEGYKLSNRSILSAIEQGNIEGEKVGNKWQMNQASFMDWYRGWKRAKDKKQQRV